jgi:hypothetical protein
MKFVFKSRMITILYVETLNWIYIGCCNVLTIEIDTSLWYFTFNYNLIILCTISFILVSFFFPIVILMACSMDTTFFKHVCN